MHNKMLLLLFVLFVDGVSGADTDQMSVIEGDSVTLHTDLTEVLNDHTILWKFGSKGSFLSQITRNKNFTSFSVTDDVVFRGRLQVDPNTGSLTIRNTRIRHSGQYQLTISRGGTRPTSKMFHVTVQHVVSGTDGVKSMQESVTEGDSITLNPDLTRIERDDLMLWMFGDNGILLAKLDVETKEISLNDAEQRFRDRLQLSQTGSLTIRNTRTTDAGLYQLQIRGRESLHQFILTVNQPGLSPGAVVGIVVAVVAVAAVAVAAGVIYYRRKISELRKQMLPVPVSVSVTVTEGEDVTLKPNYTINKDDLIQWQFGDKNLWTPIAEIRGEPREIVTYDDNVHGRFKGRLELNKTTGSLIIRNTRVAHSGLYTLQIMSSSGASQQIFFVTVNEKVEVKSVQYGDSVTLKPGTEIQRADRMLWMFGDQDDLIAQVKAGTGEIYDGAGEIFRGRLKLDEKTGSLTITNISTEHIGLYKLQTISSSRGTCKKFRVFMQMRAVQVTAGEPVHLDTGLHKIQRDDEIQWMLEDENSLIAEIKGGTGETYDGPDGIFKDRLELNKTTGSLTINNSTAKHAGRYKLKIRNSKGDIRMTYIVFIDSSEKRENESDVETALLDK